MKEQTIAILMATYNGERFLREQLDSIMVQTCHDWHLYVHDDGSTDATMDILKDYAGRFPQQISLLDYASQGGACRNFLSMMERVDAIYIATPHLSHYELTKFALEHKKHVLCETPLVLNGEQARELYALAEQNNVVLLEANKTAFSPAFNHLITMIKSGLIGDVVDINASESKLCGDKFTRELDPEQAGGSMFEMGSYPLLPIIRLMGINFTNINLYSKMENGVDVYTRGVIRYPHGVCSFQLGLGVKTEGNLVIAGTKGYAYVPAPWWLTDYYEFRFEDQNQNKKFFYKWDGAGLRYEIQEFISCIINHRFSSARLRRKESIAMADIMQQFAERKNFMEI